MKPDELLPALLTVEEVAELFRHPGNKRFVYWHASGGRFLSPAARRFGRLLLFDKAAVERILEPQKEG